MPPAPTATKRHTNRVKGTDTQDKLPPKGCRANPDSLTQITTAMQETTMNHNEYISYASEITKLEHILSIRTADDDITRIGLEHRLNKAREKLQGVRRPPTPRVLHITVQDPRNPHTEHMNVRTAALPMMAFEQLIKAETPPEVADQDCLVTGCASYPPGFSLQLPMTETEEDTYPPLGETKAEKAVSHLQDLTEALLPEAEPEHQAALLDAAAPRTTEALQQVYRLLLEHDAEAKIWMNGRQVFLGDQHAMQQAVRKLDDLSTTRDSNRR